MVRLRSLAVPLLVSAVIFAKEGIDFGAVFIGLVVWGVFVASCVLAGGALAGLACAFASARRRRFARPSRTTIASCVLVAFLVLFPVRVDWDTVEGPDTASGLTAAVNAAPSKVHLVDHPTLWYTETCCG